MSVFPLQSAYGSSECTVGNTASSISDAQTKLNAYQSSPPISGEAIICFQGNFDYDSASNTTLQMSNPWNDARLRIIGTGTGATFTLSNSDNSGFIEVTNSNPNRTVTVVFEQVTMDGNSKDGLIAKDSQLGALNIEVNNSVVKNYNRASGRGGPIYGNNVTISGSTIRNNSANEAGGAVYAFGNITVNNSDFINNTSRGTIIGNSDGGGALHSLGNITIDGSNFTDNESYLLGGATWSLGETNVADSTFTSNNTRNGGYGGAIVSNGALLVNRTTFTQNTTSLTGIGNGGAIWAGALGEVYDSTFSQNEALNGGAIYASNLYLANSTFALNSATDEGGAIYVLSGNILFTTFYENEAAPFINPNNDVPGNSVYKQGGDNLYIGSNIFTSSSSYPQIGVGSVTPTPVIDIGGNIFSSTRTVEIDLEEAQNLSYPRSLFERSLPAVFGSNTLANNGGPTQTFLLGNGSPALCAAGNVTLGSPDVRAYDQRGFQRANPFDAGSVQVSSAGSTCGSLANTGTNLFLPAIGVGVLLLSLGISLIILRNKNGSI